MSLLDKLKWRWSFSCYRKHDLFWSGVAVLLALTYSSILLANEAVQASIVAMSATTHQQIAERTLTDCMAGKAKWISEDGKTAVICERAWELKL